MGCERIRTMLRRVFWTLLLLFFTTSFHLFAINNDKAILDYTKAQYLAQEGETGKAEKLYIRAYKLSKDPEILRALIKNEITDSKYSKAKRWIKNYEKNFGNDKDILKIKAVLFYNTGQNDSLNNVYDQLYDKGERNSRFIAIYLSELFNNKEFDKSLKVLNSNRNELPKGFYFKNKAMLFNTLRDFDSSLFYFDSLKTLEDSFTTYAIMGKAMVYETKGDLNRAIKLFEELPGNFYIKDKLADLYYQTGNFNKLKADLDTLLYVNPNNARYWRYMGRVAEKGDQIQYAFAYYMTSQNLDSLEYLSCYFLGNLYTIYKDFNGSERWYKEAVKRYPNFKDGYYKIILTDIQLGSTDSAWEYLSKALKRFTFSDTDYIYNLKGQLLYDMGKSDSSKKYLLRFSNDEFTATLLASIYAYEDSTRKAVNIYKKLIEKDSSNAYIFNNLGYILANNCDTCNLDTAEYYIDKAISMSHENPYFLDSKGFVLYKKGKYDRALDYYKESLNLHPSGIACYHIALIYLAKDEVKIAKRYIRKALLYKNVTDPIIYKKIAKLGKKLHIK